VYGISRVPDGLEWRQPQGPKTKIQQPLVNIAVRQELPKSGAKISYVSSQIKSFKKTHAAANLQTLSPGEFARIEIIEQHCMRTEFLRQENCAELSNSQSILFLSRHQVRLILKIFYFDPFRLGDLRCSGQASAGDNHFAVHLHGDVNAWKEPMEEVEAAKLRQNDKRG